MEFERIGKNTVQCHMTVEEMDEYGLRIEDFFTNQEKSRDFLEQLVERAEEEIGYEVEGGMISMQLMRLPDDSLIITFSDRGEDGLHNMLNQLQNLAGMIDEDTAESIVNAITQETAAAMDEDIHNEENMEDFEKKIKKQDAYGQRQKAREQEKKKRMTAPKVFQFETLEKIERFAGILRMEKSIPSKLFKDEKTDKWYLLIKKGKLKFEEYQEICFRLQEYGRLCMNQPYIEQYCKEHYKCVINKRALQTIREYLV